MSTYLFIGGPLHGKIGSVQAGCYKTYEIDNSNTVWSFSDPFLAGTRSTLVTYWPFKLASGERVKTIFVDSRLTQEGVLQKLNEFLLDRFINE